MSSAQDGTLSPPTQVQLPPSIIRSSSLSPSRPMPSPRFDHPSSSSHPSTGVHTPLSPSPATKGSILLNKPSSNAGSTPASPTLEGAGQQPGSSQWGSAAGAGGAVLRSPISLEGQALGGDSSAIGSHSPTDAPATTDTSHTLAGAASYFVEQQQSAADASGRPSRSPSPHCHFAPLPKVEGGDRPATRRNSAAQRQGAVRPFTAGSGDKSTDDSPFAADSPTGSHSGVDHHTLASTLSNLSLHRQQQSASNASSPRASRSRHASSRSSRSPSPSPSRMDKTAAAAAAAGGRPPLTSGHSSRSHSPAMSRRASTDAMSLHYIEGSRSESGRSMSRDRSGASGEAGPIKHVGDKERELELERERLRMGRDREREGQGWKQEKEEAALASSSRPASAEPPRTASPSAAPRPTFVEPPRPSLGGRKRSNEEVVEIEPGEEKEEDLEDLAEEPEEDGEGGTGEEEDDDDEDDDEEGERSREEEDDDDEDEEVEEEPRATSRGAAVEVVHWHRSESPERQREKELARGSAQ